MAMLFARASLPAWVVILAIGAFLAPAGIVTTVLLVALGIACLPALITGGVWKRTASGDLKVSGYHYADTTAITARMPPALDDDTAANTDRVPEIIEAEFTVEDAMPTGQIRG